MCSSELVWKIWKQNCAELIAATQRPPTRNQNAPNFLHLNYWLVSTNWSLQIIVETSFYWHAHVYLAFLPFHKMFVPEAASFVLPIYNFCFSAKSVSIYERILHLLIKIENLQHFPELQKPTDLPSVPSRVTQRFLLILPLFPSW